MSGYLDIAREACERFERSQSPIKPEIESANAQRLIEAGWESKTSFGEVVIWERPDTGCYVSEEMALHLLNLSERSLQVQKT